MILAIAAFAACAAVGAVRIAADLHHRHLTALIVSYALSAIAAAVAVAYVRAVAARHKERRHRALVPRVRAFSGAARARRTPDGITCPMCGFENHRFAPSCVRCHKLLSS